ncbi:MAG: ribosome-associated translation inhibitor RaiA [Candidatus Saccharimonadales bacterium]
MINLDIAGVHIEVTDQMEKYVGKKIGKLDKYMPKNSRIPTNGKVILSSEQGKASDKYSAEVIITYPGGEATSKESTVSIYAAIDIVEEKLKAQILKHKDKVQDKSRAHKTLRRLKNFRPSR